MEMGNEKRTCNGSNINLTASSASSFSSSVGIYHRLYRFIKYFGCEVKQKSESGQNRKEKKEEKERLTLS